MVKQHIGPISQEKIVFALTILLFLGFAIALPNFLAPNNILSLLRSVAVLGMLGLAMLIVVIGRGIDLSLVATMAISVAWSVQLVSRGVPLSAALAIGLLSRGWRALAGFRSSRCRLLTPRRCFRQPSFISRSSCCLACWRARSG